VAPHIAADKDGISALVRVCELAAMLKAQGRTLLDRLDDLARQHGLHATDQLSVRVRDLSLITDAMARLRRRPPTTLGGLAVERVDDLAVATRMLPATDGVRFALARGARVVVRPSGTEPKLKCYLEVVVPVEGSPNEARNRAAQQLADIRADLTPALGI
jgi:phosphomannomutase